MDEYKRATDTTSIGHNLQGCSWVLLKKRTALNLVQDVDKNDIIRNEVGEPVAGVESSMQSGRNLSKHNPRHVGLNRKEIHIGSSDDSEEYSALVPVDLYHLGGLKSPNENFKLLSGLAI